MRHSVQTAMQVDYRGVLIVMGAFFYRLSSARENVDINIAAGIAHQELEEIALGVGVNGEHLRPGQ